MKKLLTLVSVLVLAFGFTACEDVPAPYEIPNVQPQEPGQGDTFIDESFASSLGTFTNHTTSGGGAWKIDFKTAKASGYDKDTKVTTAGTYYLVSQEVDLSGVTEAHVAFDYILRYNKGADNQQLLITDKFDPSNPSAGWTLISNTWTEGSDWTTFSRADLAVPAEFLGKKIRIAFRYNTDDKSGSTWEVKNLTLKKGKPEATAPTAPQGSNLLTNGDFEAWTAGKPDRWASASNASTATLSQSTTAHGGTSAVKVEGAADRNTRIAYQELTLKSGTYTLKFFARGEAAGASCRPGYVPVVNGVANSQGYQYGTQVNDLAADAWTEVTHTFKLTASTTLCLVVMNPKGKGNLLLDDFTLTTADGGIDATPTPTPGTSIYSKALTDNADGWTLEQGTLPSGVSFIWAQSAQYGLKASAYVGGTRYASEAWAISPAITLTQNNVLTFEHVQRYFGTASAENTLWVREGSGAWTQLTIPNYADGNSWNFISSGDIDLSAYAGKTVQFGFKYTSTATTASTWEVKNFVVK